MLPTISIGPFIVVSFQLMMLLGFLAGAAVCCVQARWLNTSTGVVWDVIPWTTFAGIIGAELYGSILTGRLVGGGMVWYGGFMLGLPVAIWRYRQWQLPAGWFIWGGAPAIALGHAIGRIGCFLAGDDYGKPTNSFIGVAFPHGAPPTTVKVHPTQLYEAAFLLVLAAVLFRLSRRRLAPHLIAATYLGAYGLWRFLIEFVRAKTDYVFMHLTTAQVISVAMMVAAIFLYFVPSLQQFKTESK